MKRKNPKPKAGMPAIHGKVVDQLARGLKPVTPPLHPLAQWALWAVGTLGLAVFFFFRIPLRGDIAEEISAGPFGLMVAFVFGGAALAAWGAIEAAIPAEESKGRWKVWAAGLLGSLAFLFFLLFLPWKADSYAVHIAPDSCFVVVFLVGLVSWVGLGFLIRRNAPLNPRRVGAWSGVAAFLLALGVITLHCGSHNLYHVCFEHFLPVLAYSWLAGWLGVRWLSGWKRKPLPPSPK